LQTGKRKQSKRTTGKKACSPLFFWRENMSSYKIIYKILKTLDTYSGREDFEYELISAAHLKVPYERWEQIMIILQKQGLIDGIVFSQTLSDKYPHIAGTVKPVITMSGMEFIENSSTMKKIEESLKLIGEFF